MIKDPIYNIFGSHDSTDTDIMVKVDSMPSIEECRNICYKLDEYFSDIYVKIPNSNICVVVDGVVTEVYKGTVDEVNNVIYHTYELHHQEFECFVTRILTRDATLKSVRALRGILSHISRTSYRTLVKEALKGSVADRVRIIRTIDFDTISDLNKNNSSIKDYHKTVAFQIGQCTGLFEGIELYTKKDISLTYPNLKPLLYRENHTESINEIISNFLNLIEANLDNLDSTYEEFKK